MSIMWVQEWKEFGKFARVFNKNDLGTNSAFLLLLQIHNTLKPYFTFQECFPLILHKLF